jgi:GNAT superfamily N-acetyltransferase
MRSEVLVKESEAVELRDGTLVIIRPIRPDDAPRLQSLFARLSRESIYYRFLELRKELSHEQARRLADLDHQTQMALVATCGHSGEEEVIGGARYAVIPGSWPAEAEAAIVVEDRHQTKGLGTLLLERLAAYAIAHGIRAFLATVRHDNSRVLRLVRRSGLPTECKVEAGALALRVGLELEPDRDSGASRVLKQEEVGVRQEGGKHYVRPRSDEFAGSDCHSERIVPRCSEADA